MFKNRFWQQNSGIALVMGLFLLAQGYKAISAFNDSFFLFDDAYMFSRYAWNLTHHGVYAWNAADGSVYGCTSILYTLWVALIQLPGWFSPTQTLTLASLSYSWLAIWLLWRIWQVAVPKEVMYRTWAGLLLLGCVVGSKVWLYHTVTGMDTMLSIAANAGLVLAVLRLSPDARVGQLARVCVAAYLAFAARPESGLYAVLLPGLYALLVVRMPKGRLAVLAGGIFVLLAVDTALKTWYFGNPLPLPFFVKQSGFYEGYAGVGIWNPVQYLISIGLLLAPWLVVYALGFRREDLRVTATFWGPIILMVLYLFGVVQIMGYEARLYFPAIPLALGATAVQFGAIARRGWPPMPGLVNRAAWLLSVFLVGQYGADHLSEAWETAVTQRYAPGLSTFFKEDLYPLSLVKLGEEEVQHVLSQLPAPASVAATEHGYLSAQVPELRIMDMTGLHDVHIAHGENPVAAVLRTQPAVIMMPYHHYVKMNRELQVLIAPEGKYRLFPHVLFGVAVHAQYPEVIAALQKMDSANHLARASYQLNF